MDWTSIYHEDGEEELLLHEIMEEMAHHQNLRCSRLVSSITHSRKSSSSAIRRPSRPYSLDDDYSSHRFFQYPSEDEQEQSNEKEHVPESSTSSSYTLFALYCLAINYILGVGCLGVPYAFAKAGVLLCLLIFTIVTFMSYVTVMWVAQTGQRFEIIRNQEKQSSASTERTSLVSKKEHEMEIIESNFEVLDLMGYYVGYYAQLLYQISFMALMYIGLLAYSQVFCGSIAAVIPQLKNGLPQVLFGMVVVPLSCMELEEQVSIQAIMAFVRFIAIFIMIAGSILAFILQYHNNQNSQMEIYKGADIGNVSLWEGNGFAVAFSTALFSQVFQHSVPGLVRPLEKSKLSKVPAVFGASLLTTYSLYVLLGAVTVSYFGKDDVKSSINLNFVNFTFGFTLSRNNRIGKMICTVASQIVVMFPALDTLSVFPLIANTLGNNLFSSSPGFVQWIHRHFIVRTATNNQPQYYNREEKIHQWKRASRIANITWKLIASLPPLIGSIWSTNLAFSFLLAGLSGVYVAFIAPSLMQWYSMKHFKKHNNDNDLITINGWYSSTSWIIPVISFATFAMVMLFFQIADYLLHQ